MTDMTEWSEEEFNTTMLTAKGRKEAIDFIFKPLADFIIARANYMKNPKNNTFPEPTENTLFGMDEKSVQIAIREAIGINEYRDAAVREAYCFMNGEYGDYEPLSYSNKSIFSFNQHHQPDCKELVDKAAMHENYYLCDTYANGLISNPFPSEKTSR
jgi:hypothetical protein